MKIDSFTTIAIMTRVFLMMALLIFVSGQLRARLKKKFGNDNIMSAVVSIESILALAAYFIIYYVLSFVWPTGWESFSNSSGVFWPVQGLVILALIGFTCLEKLKFLPWFFVSMAVILTAVGLWRDPSLNRASKKKETKYITIEKQTPPRIITTTVVIEKTPVEFTEGHSHEPVAYEPKVEEKPAPTSNDKKDSIFYVDALADENGEPLSGEIVPKPPLGWQDDFWPEKDVWCLVNPNSKTSMKFKYGPDRSQFKQIILSEPSDLAFASRCRHNTRVKVVRSWIGSGNGRY